MQLLLDSSGSMLVAALAADGRVLRKRAVASISPEGRDIGALVAGLLDGHAPDALSAIGVGIGPGSFIGTRVALSFANGLAAAGSLPVHPVPTLAAFAAVAERCIILRDARRGEAYLHDSAGDLGGARLVALDALAGELAERPGAMVIAEEPAPDDKRGGNWQTAVTTACAGRGLLWAAHVPAEGLLALLPSCPPRELAEPIYLRGFL
jgi:tRNA threonylcarbamoyladenosine biosynthesis protein TsaB